MKKKILIFLLSMFVLSACGTENNGDVSSTEVETNRSEGYFLKTDKADFIIVKGDSVLLEDGTPVKLVNEEGNRMDFEEQENGDLIAVYYEVVEASNPLQVPVLSYEPIEKGTIDKIPKEIISDIQEQGYAVID